MTDNAPCHPLDDRFIGKLALCQQGKLGYITQTGTYFWKGIRLEDGEAWQSGNPTILSSKRVADILEMSEVDLEIHITKLLYGEPLHSKAS